MDVSFVIPSYNQGRFLQRCIASCLAQRGIDRREVIVMDGGSTDESVDVLRSFGDQVDWVSERDQGQSDAIHRGVLKASGAVIAWINSDDYYPADDVLQRVIAAFEESPDVDLVYGDGEFVNIRGERLRTYGVRTINDPRDLWLSPSSPILQPALFFRRSLYLDVGGLDRSLHWTMDYELWLRMFPHAKQTWRLPGVLAAATCHDDAKSIAGMRKQMRELSAVKARYAPRFQRNWFDRARLAWGAARLRVFHLAVRAGLKRIT